MTFNLASGENVVQILDLCSDFTMHVTDCSARYRIRTPAHSGNCSHRYLFTTNNAYPSWMGPCLFSEFDETASDDLDEDDGNVIGTCVYMLIVYVQTLHV